MRCTSCGEANPEEGKFCLNCGVTLKLRCPQCDAESPSPAKFCGQCGIALTQNEAIQGGKGKTEREKGKRRNGETGADLGRRMSDTGQNDAERRQLTVMFCDLVGSTALSEQLDPEDFRELVRAYQQASAEVIARYDGHIAQYLGDGLLVYFGHPVAHEDDASRAVRAALGILQAMQELNPRLPHPLQVRIGIHTGLVVIGEMGGGVKRELLALGVTPNIAARVQGIAAPDEVVMSASTARLTQGLFISRALGLQDLKGISTPMALYQVQGESGVQSRFAATLITGLIPLVGREDESKLLWQRWEQVKTGTGQAMLLSGEPGIGKSRLLQTLKESITTESHLLLEGHCSPYYQNSPLYSLIDLLQRVLQFEQGDTSDDKLRKLERVLAATGDSLPEAVPLWAALLSLPLPQHYPALALAPQKQKERTQQAILTWLLARAKEKPLFLVWEDLQWADPSTLEFLAFLIDHITSAPVYLLLTARPEFTPPWADRPHVAVEALSRLPHDQTRELVMQITGGKLLPPEVLRQIITKTDGVPLFVEELTKTVLESGLLTALRGGYELTSPLLALAIPSTLQDSLMARLDRLGTSKEVAQLGATLGREFTYGLIQAVSPLKEPQLQQELEQLVHAEFLYQQGTLPQASYLFKHALIQDTAYQSLLKSTRQQLHQQIATVLESQFPETAETQPELLAHHYTEAGRGAQAIPYWQSAGQKSVARSANFEAVSHLTKGIELLKASPDSSTRLQQELVMQTLLGPALMITKRQDAPEAGAAYQRAYEICQQLGEVPQLFTTLAGLRRFYAGRADLYTTREIAQQMLTIAQRTGEPALLVESHHALGNTLYYLGEFAPAQAQVEQGIAIHDPQQHRSLAFVHGLDPGVQCRNFAANVLWLLGYPEQARRRSPEALAVAQECAHPHTTLFALIFSLILYQLREERSLVQERAESIIAFCTEYDLPLHFLGNGMLLRNWALHKQGQKDDSEALIPEGFHAWRTFPPSGGWQSWLYGVLAEMYAEEGNVEEGLAVLIRMLEMVEEGGIRWYEAELYRLKGQLTLQKFQAEDSLGSSAQSLESEAEEYFQKAIETARKQQARSLELRAATSLARLWQRQGKQKEAHQMLVDIYGWFTEGFDSKDLQEAKALLEELS